MMIIDPCARLMRLVTPQMTENPIAMQAYRPPSRTPLRMTSSASTVPAARSALGNRVQELRLGLRRRIDHDRLAVLDLHHRHPLSDVLAFLVEAHRAVHRHDVGLRDGVAHLLWLKRARLLERALVDLERRHGLRRMVVGKVAGLL